MMAFKGSMFGNLQPFGEVSYENEIDKLGEKYQAYYFHDSEFNKQVTDPEVYLIVGRRGTGKSSIAKYFSFQKRIRNCESIILTHEDTYEIILDLFEKVPIDRISKFEKIWKMIIWSHLFEHFKDNDPDISKSLNIINHSKFFKDIIRGAAKKFIGLETDLFDRLDNLLKDKQVQKGISNVMLLTQKTPVIIAIDSKEHYYDDKEMKILAALVSVASEINMKYSRFGIHIKVFIAAEVSIKLTDQYLENPNKQFRTPMYMHWDVPEIKKLLCWRFFLFLKDSGLLKSEQSLINWDDKNSINEKLWWPYFGKTIKNSNGKDEDSFKYIIRHSQYRPRQLVMYCNDAMNEALKKNLDRPVVTEAMLRYSVKKIEVDLASEILNAYRDSYPNLDKIIESSLTGLGKVFKASELDKIAKKSKPHWKESTFPYEKEQFKRLLIETGIIGKVDQEKSDKSVIHAHFEYLTKGRISLNDDIDECVVHPMFYHKVCIDVKKDLRVVNPIFIDEF